MKNPKPIIVGNYKPSGHGCGKIHHGGGIASTVMENHGCSLAIIEIVKYDKGNKIERNH